MFFRSKTLVLRFFTLALMAVAIGITYPGTSASAGTSSEQQCIQNCGSYHNTLLQCYQQAHCKRGCRNAECQRIYDNMTAPCEPNGPGLPDPRCEYYARPIYDDCKAAATSSHSAAISSCDRLYWEHCPDPE